MDKKEKKEIISRRQFFKKSAGIVLPAIGMAILPQVFTSCEIDEPYIDPDSLGGGSGCKNCSSSCTCNTLCNDLCEDSCLTECGGQCSNSCRTSCYESCREGCGSSCKKMCTSTMVI